MNNDLLKFVKVLLRGAGQVMFQNNAWTGLFFILGITVGSAIADLPQVAIGAILGLIVSTVTGYILNLPQEEGESGLWGFNGILVGCAIPTFMGNTPLMWVIIILGSALTTWVRTGLNNVMAPWKVNSFTFPFVFTTWIFLMSVHSFDGLWGEYMALPSLLTEFSPDIDTSINRLPDYWLKNISQVFLINSWLSGFLFLIGLYLSSKWAAIWAAIASAIALFIAILFQAAGNDIANGLYGFSAVLTGIAIGCTFYKPTWRSAAWAVIAIIVTVFVQAATNAMFSPFGIATLTAPFCVTTWLFLLPRLNIDKPVPPRTRPDHSHWHKKNTTR